MFKLESNYSPTGDQPEAIQKIVEGFENGLKVSTLLGATGTGKTFTMANVINQIKRPTLIMSHNKTLAAQLATEFKYFFPNNAVHYFVSYFDYYQPESYLPQQDMYIEKESTINKEIEMYRLSAMASLLSREDIIIVSSVSSLYGLGSKDVFEKNSIKFQVGESYDFSWLKKQLLNMQYHPVQSKIEPGMFDFRGEILDVFSSIENTLYRLIFDEEKLEMIQIKDSNTFEEKGTLNNFTLRPASQFLQDMDGLEYILKDIQEEMEQRVEYFKKEGKELEANRIQKRTMYDIKMIKQTGFTNGIENYSRYFDGRQPGQPPSTIFDYFPDDFLFIVDESHQSIPQLQAMPKADNSRKKTLVEHGFRLPSAIDHRPLNFEELENMLSWKSNDVSSIQKERVKSAAKTMFVSATPADYEINVSDNFAEQIIRPTGLLDPVCYVYPKDGDYQYLLKTYEKLIKTKPHLKKYFESYRKDVNIKDIIIDDFNG
ncbi:DEAD/DEAH box helicase family protein [Candidatus Absconditicoccus praedator]|uniref:DEAD/DEAH box helicase family protein n=1 Tax=Candidatus Absconditicoccus praedator TaxID=2735562 RepID=UPI001E53FB47|nr:DEAD/DEAH box helicase family protein [Candidatus Absconditicoccus praedator]UFX83079.1 DEAD/DEAH box helicase family protein [Candidatus Absconditicoccus praedator]